MKHPSSSLLLVRSPELTSYNFNMERKAFAICLMNIDHSVSGDSLKSVDPSKAGKWKKYCDLKAAFYEAYVSIISTNSCDCCTFALLQASQPHTDHLLLTIIPTTYRQINLPTNPVCPIVPLLPHHLDAELQFAIRTTLKKTM